MKNHILKLLLVLLLACTPVYANEEHGDHGDEHGHEEETEGTVIDDHVAKEMKIELAQVGAGTVRQIVSLTGKVILNQNQVAQVRARFPGIVKDVKVNMGDTVKKGQILAVIESNESLQSYNVVSPLDGVILGRNTNIGDTAADASIFVVADLKKLWAEFFIFSRDMASIKAGQPIRVKSLTDGTEAETVLSSLLPTTESSSQTVVARVELDNPEDKWRAGMTVRGDVTLSEHDVQLAVKTSALQRQDGNTVIYVREGERYEMRKVETGQSDSDWTEILSGIEAGENYVATNSFIIKADIAKSEAEHEH